MDIEYRLLEAVTLAQIAKKIIPNATAYLKNSASIGDFTVVDAPGFHSPEDLMDLAIKTGLLDDKVKAQLNTLITQFKKANPDGARMEAIKS